MAWCEGSGIDYVFGLARNARLQRALGAELHAAALQSSRRGSRPDVSRSSATRRGAVGAERGAWSAKPSTPLASLTRASS